MRIQTRVKIGGALTVCVLLAYGALILYLDRTMVNLSHEVKQANEIVVKIVLLRNLTQDYLLYRTERAQRQWSGVYTEVLQLLDHPEYRALQSRHGIEDTHDRLKNVADSFSRVIGLMENPGPGTPAAELQNRLSTQLLLTTQNLMSRFFNLNEQINQKLFATQRQTSILNILALLVLGGFLISNLVFLQRSVVKPVLQLQAGAAIVGAGNLEHRVGLKARDEMGQLSRAFDEMTANLRKTLIRLEEEVAERQRAEGVIQTSHHFLQMMNRITKSTDLLRDFVAEVKQLTQCEAVGIRILDNAGNIPYHGYTGFSKEFYEMESPLVIHSDKCMCINVIKGTTDPDLPFYTPGGSFYINATTRFLATVSEADKGETRNICNAVGYESVALVPIRLGEQILGLIHVADPKEGMVSREKVELLELIALQLGPALERIGAQAALDLERQRFFSVLERIPSYVALISADCKMPYVNSEFIRRFGDPKDKLCYDFLFGLDAPCEGCKALEVFKTNIPAIWEWHGPDGNYYQIYDYPFTDADGSPLVLEMGVDISARKRAEAEILALNQDLERRVRERTADLERSNRELEEFAYISSHDIQEPLRQIANFAEILARDYRERLDEQALRYFGFIASGAKRMQALINDLLAYSTVDQEEIPRAPTPLEDILQGTIRDLQTLIRESAAEISHDPLPTLKVNANLMGRLLQNLIANALKFRGDESPRIHLSARQEDGEWVVSVKDNGIGFNPKFAERIFKLFKRMHSEESYPGTGVGLAICKKIVERHGGRIWAESEPGRGATFYFTIPA